MARAALGWGVRDLARTAKVASDTISRLERGEQLRDRTLDDIRAVFEAAGIEFLDDNGVKLKAKPGAPKRQPSWQRTEAVQLQEDRRTPSEEARRLGSSGNRGTDQGSADQGVARAGRRVDR